MHELAYHVVCVKIRTKIDTITKYENTRRRGIFSLRARVGIPVSLSLSVSL